MPFQTWLSEGQDPTTQAEDNAITRQLPATADRLNQFCTETAHDEELVLLKHTVQTGWPQDICGLPKEIQPYWTFCEEMTIEDGLLL